LLLLSSIFNKEFKGRPDLLVLLLTSGFEASEIEEEIKHLKKLDSLGIKTPKHYSQLCKNKTNKKPES
jgi:hypothetical protein